MPQGGPAGAQREAERNLKPSRSWPPIPDYHWYGPGPPARSCGQQQLDPVKFENKLAAQKLCFVRRQNL